MNTTHSISKEERLNAAHFSSDSHDDCSMQRRFLQLPGAPTERESHCGIDEEGVPVQK